METRVTESVGIHARLIDWGEKGHALIEGAFRPETLESKEPGLGAWKEGVDTSSAITWNEKTTVDLCGVKS